MANLIRDHEFSTLLSWSPQFEKQVKTSTVLFLIMLPVTFFLVSFTALVSCFILGMFGIIAGNLAMVLMFLFVTLTTLFYKLTKTLTNKTRKAPS